MRLGVLAKAGVEIKQEPGKLLPALSVILAALACISVDWQLCGFFSRSFII